MLLSAVAAAAATECMRCAWVPFTIATKSHNMHECMQYIWMSCDCNNATDCCRCHIECMYFHLWDVKCDSLSCQFILSVYAVYVQCAQTHSSNTRLDKGVLSVQNECTLYTWILFRVTSTSRTKILMKIYLLWRLEIGEWRTLHWLFLLFLNSFRTFFVHK